MARDVDEDRAREDEGGGPDGAARLLTPRQLEVLELMAKGLTNREIAGVLAISLGTVKAHVSAVIDALDVTNRTEAAVALEALGLGQRGAAASPDGGEEEDAFRVPGFGGRPALAVLPFPYTGPEDDGHLADGLAEDLITRLAGYRWFPVIARNSTFAYQGRAVDVREMSRELGARYLVEGSVRAAGSRVRVTIQLIDGTSGEHLFAERYDRERADVFALQDELVETIVAALDPALSRVERMRAARKAPGDLSSWECLKRGLFHMYQGGRVHLEEARALFERALEGDPHLAAAWSGLAQVHCFEIAQTIAADPDHGRAEALRAAHRSVEEDPADPVSHGTLGLASSFSLRLDEAAEAFEHAIHLNPSYAAAYWGLAALRLRQGPPAEARELLARALRLSPHDPLEYMMRAHQGLIELAEDDLEAALAQGREAARLRPDQPFGHLVAAVALALLSRSDEAREARARLEAAAPGFRLDLLRAVLPESVTGAVEAGWARIP